MTPEDTVHAALRAAIAESERGEERLKCLINSAGGPDLADDQIMSGAWVA